MKKHLKWLFPYFKPYKKQIFIGIFFVVLTGILDQTIPWLTKVFFDRLDNHEAFSWWFFLEPLLCILCVSIVSGILLRFQRHLVIGSSRRIEYQIRKDLLQELLKQPQVFFDQQKTGDLMSRLTNDLDRIRDFLGPVTLHLNRMTLNTVFTLIALLLLNPYLMVIGLIPVCLLPLFVNRFLKVTHRLHGKIQHNLGVLNTFIQDSISGIQIIKVYGKENEFNRKFEQHSEEFRKESAKVAFVTSALWPFISFLSSIGLLLVIWQGSKMVITNEITIGTLAATFLYLLRLQPPLSGLGWVLNLIQRANAAMDRVLIMRESFTFKEEEQLFPLELKNYHLEFKNLNFAYPNSQRKVFKQFKPSNSSRKLTRNRWKNGIWKNNFITPHLQNL